MFVSSMAQQHGSRGLRVRVIAAPGPYEPANVAADWGLDPSVFERDALGALAKRYGVTRRPTTLLLDADGRVRARWDGLVLPASLAGAIEEALPPRGRGQSSTR